MILVIGDTHFKENSDSMRRNALMVESVLKICEERKDIKAIVLLGDILDKHEKVHTDAMKQATNFMVELSHHADLYALIGNHDLKDNKQYLSDIHAFTAFKECPKIHIIERPYEFEVSGRYFLGVPYVPANRFNEMIEMYDCKKYTAIFAHQEFKGSQIYKGKISENADKAPENTLIISGHLHERHTVGNVLYLGTPIQQNFAENLDKGVSIFSLPDMLEERFRLDVPNKITYNINCDEIEKTKVIEGPDTRIVISGGKEEIDNMLSCSILKKYVKSGCKIKKNVIRKEQKYKPEKEQKIFGDILREKIRDTDLERIYEKIFVQ